MQYGYFDDDHKEYVITRPDTPQSWSNYLGSTEYGAIITNNAGGYGFYKSGATGRFLRLRFNSLPMDQPGRYFYLRDRDSGDYWSASWQPVGKPLDQYHSVCRHGTAYTVIASDYAGISTQTSYFVPLDECFEYWLLKVSNTSDRPRRLDIFTYLRVYQPVEYHPGPGQPAIFPLHRQRREDLQRSAAHRHSRQPHHCFSRSGRRRLQHADLDGIGRCAGGWVRHQPRSFHRCLSRLP